MNEQITAKLEVLSTKLSELEDNLDEAKCRASDAEDQAWDAKNHAEEASNTAGNAKEYAEQAERDLGNARDALTDLINELAKDEDTDATTSGLEADTQKWRRRVLALRKNGLTPPQIAKELTISEFLVNHCLKTAQAA